MSCCSQLRGQAGIHTGGHSFLAQRELPARIQRQSLLVYHHHRPHDGSYILMTRASLAAAFILFYTPFPFPSIRIHDNEDASYF